MSNMRGFDAAQREYDNRTPPDDGPSECAECGGKGVIYTDDPMGLGCDEREDCTECAGFGFIDDNGQPFNPRAAEEAEYDRADYLHQCAKDRRATGD